MSRVFISYSRKDRPFVERLVMDLTTRLPELQIFYDMLIQPGESWAETLAAQFEQADVILVLLSPDYLVSQWTTQELNMALERQLQKQARLVPLLIRPCNPTGLLSQLTWIDFTEDYEAGFARLMWGVTGERPRTAKGEEPGKPIKAIDSTEVEHLRREVQAAVELFKSRATEPVPAFEPKAATERPAGERK